MLLAAGPSADLFPHRKQCDWIEQGNGLSVRMCEDGEVLMWHDTNTRETWLHGEQPPKRWRKFFRQHHFSGALGDGEPGVCPPKSTVKPTPLAKIRRLQNALRGLATRVKDRAISVVADGLIGPHTVVATNRALSVHAPGFTSGGLTKTQVVKLSPQIAAYLEKAPYVAKPAPFVATAPPMVQPIMPAAMPGGAPTMPGYYPPPPPTYYAPPPAYGPPGYGPSYAPPRAPGGLPANQATLDVRAFIPAQYEHVRITPATGIAIVAIGLLVVAAVGKLRGEHHHKRGD